MKKFVTLTSMALVCAAMSAQNYISTPPEGGFNVEGGKDYVVLYAPENILEAMGPKLISNQNLDATQQRNYLEYWTTDWDPKALTLYNVPEEGGINSFGGEEYINATPLYAWGTGVFMATGTPYDLSAVTDAHHIHIGLRDFGSAPSKYQFSVGPIYNIKANGFQIEVGIEKGAADGDFVGIGSLPNGNDGNWYYLDVPVTDLIDENGDFGFVYDFTEPINGGAFSFSFKDPVCSTETHTAPGPGESVYNYTITQLGSALSLDHVFFYIPDASGVESISDIENGATEYFDLQGRRVSNPSAGLYIERRGSEVKKVMIR